MLVSGGRVVKAIPGVKVHEGEGKAVWRDVIYKGFDERTDDLPGRVVFE